MYQTEVNNLNGILQTINFVLFWHAALHAEQREQKFGIPKWQFD